MHGCAPRMFAKNMTGTKILRITKVHIHILGTGAFSVPLHVSLRRQSSNIFN